MYFFNWLQAMWTKERNNGRQTKWVANTKKLGRSEHPGCYIKQRQVSYMFINKDLFILLDVLLFLTLLCILIPCYIIVNFRFILGLQTVFLTTHKYHSKPQCNIAPKPIMKGKNAGIWPALLEQNQSGICMFGTKLITDFPRLALKYAMQILLHC